MPCDSRLKQGQTIQQRAEEVRKVVTRLDQLIASKQAKVRVSRLGGVAFTGLADNEREGVTDACLYRRIMATGSALARAEIAQAEKFAGVQVSRKALAQGVHSHDGGANWHSHKG